MEEYYDTKYGWTANVDGDGDIELNLIGDDHPDVYLERADLVKMIEMIDANAKGEQA